MRAQLVFRERDACNHSKKKSKNNPCTVFIPEFGESFFPYFFLIDRFWKYENWHQKNIFPWVGKLGPDSYCFKNLFSILFFCFLPAWITGVNLVIFSHCPQTHPNGGPNSCVFKGTCFFLSWLSSLWKTAVNLEIFETHSKPGPNSCVFKSLLSFFSLLSVHLFRKQEWIWRFCGWIWNTSANTIFYWFQVFE